MKKTTGKQAKPFKHTLKGYVVCVLLVFTTLFVVLLFDHDFRFKTLGWLDNNIFYKVASLIPNYGNVETSVGDPIPTTYYGSKTIGTW